MRSLLILFIFSTFCFSQTNDNFSYQAIVRDSGGDIINNATVGIEITILKSNPTGTQVYKESFAPVTNDGGAFRIEIGNGSVIQGDFQTIDWAMDDYFIQTAVDFSGGTNYTIMGTTQLLAVPTTLHSKFTSGVAVRTMLQRDVLSSPKTGQMLFCSDCNGGELQIFDGTIWRGL